MSRSRRTLLLLDAPSLIYRAFFALPTSMKGTDGRAVNAVRGFMDMTADLIRTRSPDEVIVALDADWRPVFRVEAYAGYKAARPEDPPELPHQFEIIGEVLDAAGIVTVESPGVEADDALATLVENLEPDEKAWIVTGDRDLLALVKDPQVGVLFTVKGVSKLDEFDEAAVEAKYGLPPRLYSEFATLRGDPSDGLPGVAGVGPKTAVDLLRRYGSIEGILENLEALSLRQRAAFEAARSYLEAMKTVVGMLRDATLKMTEAHEPDEPALMALAEKHSLGGSAERLLQALRSTT